MTVAPFYLSFIGNKMEVKIRTLILFEQSCYLIRQLAKTKEVKPRKHEDIEVLIFFLFFFLNIETKDVESYEAQCGPPWVHRMNRKAWFEVLTR